MSTQTSSRRFSAGRSAEALRKSELARIHIHKQQLGMDDDAYRALLADKCGVRSASELDWQGRKRLLDHLQACLKASGINPNPGRLPTKHRPLAMSKEAIEAKIAVQLKALGKGWDYAYGVARRIYPHVSRFEFLGAPELGKVSSALERTIRYRSRGANA